MEIKQGYAYHIKDEYFTMAKDEHLMKIRKMVIIDQRCIA